MPNPKHLDKLKEGAKSWNEWRSQEYKETPDLSDVDFTDKELFGSFIDDKNILDFSGLNFKHCVLTNAIFSNCTLTSCIFQNANLENSKFNSADISGSIFDGSNAKSANFGLAIAKSTQFASANLESAILSSAVFTDSSFHNANLKKTFITATDFYGANLSGVDDFFPRWTTSFIGTPKFPNYPKTTSLENIHGLSPHTKKILSDGMYLKSLWEKKNSFWKRLPLRLWGISCGYGQNTKRWIVLSFTLMIIFALMYVHIEMNIATYIPQAHKIEMSVGKPDFVTSLYYSTITFVTLGYGDVIPFTTSGKIIAMIEVCIGYVMLGGLVSIFSNKLARLS